MTTPRKQVVPPPTIPDLRFEQSYQRALQPANGSWLWIAVFTLRDQVVMPLVQGFGWAFIVIGFRSWQSGVQRNGSTVGSYLRYLLTGQRSKI